MLCKAHQREIVALGLCAECITTYQREYIDDFWAHNSRMINFGPLDSATETPLHLVVRPVKSTDNECSTRNNPVTI